MNKLAVTGRWQHCALGFGGERPPKTSRVKRDALRLRTLHVSLTASPRSTSGLDPTTTAFAFRNKVFQPRLPASVLLFFSKQLIFPVFLSSSSFSWRVWRRLSPQHGALRANGFLTWQNGKKLTEFSEPLTFFIAPFLMPSLLKCGGAPWRNKWDILEEQFDHRGAKKKILNIFLFVYSFGRVITHDAQRNGVSS